MRSIANFLFEMGMLAKTPRSGYTFLGTGEQSVAEHTNRVCYIGYVLAKLAGDVDVGKIVMMCLFHDIAETRSLDHNYVAQRYVKVDEHAITQDQIKDLSFAPDMATLIGEYETRESKESLLAKDADNIELILFCKEQFDIGNPNAKDWIDISIQRVKTDVGKKLVNEIINTPYNDWWAYNKKDSRWINRTTS